MDRLQQYVQDFKESDLVLVCIGELMPSCDKEGRLKSLMNELSGKLKTKAYFVLNTSDTDLSDTDIKSTHLVQTSFLDEQRWTAYNTWLAACLKMKMTILELGEGFSKPNIARWPFERLTFVSEKTRLYRVNEAFPELPKELSEAKAVSVKQNPVEFLAEVCKYL